MTATFTGGALTDVTVDHSWAGRTGGSEIAAAITEAIRQGYAAVDRLTAQSVTQRWPFPDLHAITSDPATLLATLGLTTPRTDNHRAEGA